MGDSATRRNWRVFLLVLVAAGGLAAASAAWIYFNRAPHVVPPPADAPPVQTGGDIPAQVHDFCTACHAYPPPDSFPRSAWEDEVQLAYMFYKQSNLSLSPPPSAQAIKYYQERAPENLKLPVIERAPGPPPIAFASTNVPTCPGRRSPMSIWSISSMNAVWMCWLATCAPAW